MDVEANVKLSFDEVLIEFHCLLSCISCDVKTVDFYLCENQKMFAILRSLRIHASPRVTSRKAISNLRRYHLNK